MKLKTLNDIENLGMLRENIKQEAIKWYKFKKEESINDLHIIELSDWFEFFNITKYDLTQDLDDLKKEDLK